MVLTIIKKQMSRFLKIFREMTRKREMMPVGTQRKESFFIPGKSLVFSTAKKETINFYVGLATCCQYAEGEI